jgi:hypothetical protein
MRRLLVAAALIFVALPIVTPKLGYAQGQLPEPPVGFQPPPPAPPPPINPYKPVSAIPAGPYSDPTFAAFRNTLADIAKRKDRTALAKLIVPQDFFWVQDKNLADPSKSGVDNLAKAIDLDNPNGSGWDILTSDAADPSLAELPQDKGLFCAPAPPKFDPQAFQALFQDTETDPTDWGYPTTNGVEVHAAAKPDAQVIEKLGTYFVRVLPDSAPQGGGAPSFLHLALPDGKTGFVAIDSVVPLASDQICYIKGPDSWQIAGYIGGVQP